MHPTICPDIPLSRGEYRRQSRVIISATEALSTNDAVREFLNSHHAALGGRPLDLAIASQSGLLAVETALLWNALNPSRSSSCDERSRSCGHSRMRNA